MSRTNPRLEMSTAEMRELGYRAVDLIVDYFETLETLPPVALATRAEMDAVFDHEIPEFGRPAQEILDEVTTELLSHTDHVAHPKFYSFVPSPSNFVSVIADFLTTGFNVFSGGWIASPAAAEIEIITVNWLLELFGFETTPGGGGYTSGGSMANLTGLATARKIILDDVIEGAVIYMSEEAHSSNHRAARILGFGRDQIRLIPTDDEFRLRSDLLRQEILEDAAAGRRPFCILATSGTTNTGAVDPLNDIADLCDEFKIWMHVDGAYGGAAILTAQGRALLDGISRAHSITVDPHKWFFQPYEIGCILVREAKWLSQTFAENPHYLRDLQGSPEEINFYDHGVQLTRQFRALKLYMSVKTFGLANFRDAVQHGLDLAAEVGELLRASDVWEVLSPPSLGVVVFRYHPRDHDHAEHELDHMNDQVSLHVVEEGEAMLATTVCNGHVALRMCLINPRTTLAHVQETLTFAEATFAS